MESPSSSWVCTDLTRYCHNCCFDSLIPSSVCCCGFGLSFSKCMVLQLALPWLFHPLRASKGYKQNQTRFCSIVQAKCSAKWNTGAALHHTKWNQDIQEVNCRYWICKCHPGCLLTDQCFQTWAFLLSASFFKSSLNLRQSVPWRSPAYPSGTNLILVLFKNIILNSLLFHLL